MGEAREVMDRVTKAVVGKDLETLSTLYAPQAVAVDPNVGEIQGPENIVEYFKGFHEAFPDLKWEPSREFESGNTAIDEGYVVGTNTGPIPLPSGETIPPTGKSLRLRECDILTVENGVATSHRFYYDQMEFLDQLGLTPGTPS
ncbi:MAG: nuclear transport factor 2 family protein [Actinomycetota bacterium]